MRTDLVNLIADESEGSLSVVHLDNGWPSRLALSSDMSQLFDLYVARVSSMSRKDGESRFQNPVQVPGNERPIVDRGVPVVLAGVDLDADPPVVVVADGSSRIGRTTRFSILFPETLVKSGREDGWGSFTSSSTEVMRAFHASLFSEVISAAGTGDWPSDVDASAVVRASGLGAAPDEPEARERARREVRVLVRDGSFGRQVRNRFGDRCAICGLAGIGLIVGAHIYPVEAIDSVDVPTNGVALCQNHHAAFDRHMWTVGHDLRIRWQPAVLSDAQAEKPLDSFIGDSEGTDVSSWPIDFDWVQRRQEFYEGSYDWL